MGIYDHKCHFQFIPFLHICPIAFSVAEWVGCSFIFSKVAIKIEPWRHWGEVMSCHQITSRSDINKRLHFLTQTNERKQNKRGIEFWPEEKSLFPLEKKISLSSVNQVKKENLEHLDICTLITYNKNQLTHHIYISKGLFWKFVWNGGVKKKKSFSLTLFLNVFMLNLTPVLM